MNSPRLALGLKLHALALKCHPAIALGLKQWADQQTDAALEAKLASDRYIRVPEHTHALRARRSTNVSAPAAMTTSTTATATSSDSPTAPDISRTNTLRTPTGTRSPTPGQSRTRSDSKPATPPAAVSSTSAPATTTRRRAVGTNRTRSTKSATSHRTIGTALLLTIQLTDPTRLVSFPEPRLPSTARAAQPNRRQFLKQTQQVLP